MKGQVRTCDKCGEYFEQQVNDILTCNACLIREGDRKLAALKPRPTSCPACWNENHTEVGLIHQEGAVPYCPRCAWQPTIDRSLEREPVGKVEIVKEKEYGGQRHLEPKDEEQLELLPYGPLRRIARHLHFGTQKYERYNWEKGLPVDQSLRRLLHHVLQYLDGERDEDHLAAAGCNLFFAMEHETKHEWTKNLRPEKVRDP